MKKILSLSIAFIMAVGFLGVMSEPTFAGTSVTKAKAGYVNAMKAEQIAKSKYTTANQKYASGAYGFYQWVAANNTGWKRTDAQEALQILTKSAHRKYTKAGNSNDAISLKNMRAAVNLFPTLQKKRAGDNYHPNLQAPTIRNVFMARAQVNANASSYTFSHMMGDSGCGLADAFECLAWGYSDPFDGWYDEEKVNYTNVRNYTLKKYGKDITTPEWDSFVEQDGFDYDAYLKEIAKFGETGLYENVCLSGWGEEKAKRVFFGMAYSAYGACHSLEALPDEYDTGYTVAEYTTMFNQYFAKVYPKNELAAYNKAKSNTRTALKSLKKAAAPKKPTAKRSGKKVRVKWKKVKGVSGYQISVSPKRSKTKIAATAGAKSVKKTVKLSKSKKQFVKVRSYVTINNKRIYSNWSPVRATK